MYQHKEDYGCSFDFNFGLLAKVCIFISIICFVAFCCFGSSYFKNYEKGKLVKESIKNQKTTTIVKALAEIPRSATLYRVADLETDTVCYLNAIGGGIQCFSLRDITNSMLKPLPEDFFEPVKIKRHTYNGAYRGN